MKKHIIPRSFFNRPPRGVARELLGKYLVRAARDPKTGVIAEERAVMITEVEAYDGPHDRASHAFHGLTPRTKVMFGPPGVFYMFFTYGMHWMANIVTGPGKYPSAILFRGGVYEDPRTGARMEIKGPARLAKFLGLDRTQNGIPASRKNGLWFEDRGIVVPRTKIVTAKRIGVEYAGDVWANKPYNFSWQHLTISKKYDKK